MKHERATIQSLGIDEQARTKRQARIKKEKEQAKSNSNCNTLSEKDVLLGRGKLIWERNSNKHLRNFVDVFRDNYETLGHTERQRIVRMIVELLQNDGYSFLKTNPVVWVGTNHPGTAMSGHEKSSSSCQSKCTHATAINTVSNSNSSSEDSHSRTCILNKDSSNGEDGDGSNNCVSWVVAPPSDVHQEVTRLFRKNRKCGGTYTLNDSFDTVDQIRSGAQQQVEQQQLEALHHAITAAIDTTSLVETIRNFPSPKSSPLLSSTPSLLSPLADPTFDQSHQQQQQHLLPPLPLTLPASLVETKTTVEEPHVRTITTRTSTNASATSTTSIMNSQGITKPSCETTIQARKLLEQHLGSTLSPTPSPPASPKLSSNGKERCSHHHDCKTSALPKDGVLWSRGCRKICLLEDMSNSIVPITSYSLFPTPEKDAFGALLPSGANPPRATGDATSIGTMIESSRTIGYTQQRIGHLSILRPIVLLPGIHNCGSTDNAVAL